MNSESAARVAQVVWQWRTPLKKTVSGNWRRQRGALLRCAITAALATLLSLVFGRYRFGLFLYILSAVILVCGFLVPRAFDALERFGQKLAYGVGFLLTWLLLVPFFYLCFFPGRLILLLSGKDPMCRRYEREKSSYWMDRAPARDARFYTRQY